MNEKIIFVSGGILPVLSEEGGSKKLTRQLLRKSRKLIEAYKAQGYKCEVAKYIDIDNAWKIIVTRVLRYFKEMIE